MAAIAAAPRATPATVLASLLVGTNRFAVLVTVFAALLNRFFLAMRYNVVRNLNVPHENIEAGCESDRDVDPNATVKCPLFRVKRTCHFALHMSAFDLKRTSSIP